MLEKLAILNNHDKEKFSLFEDVKIIETEGEKQFLHFWEKRPASAELSNNVTYTIYWTTTTRSQLITL